MVVRVNDETIGALDVDRATELLFVQYRSQIPPDKADQARKVLQRQAVENLINQKLLLSEAERQGTIGLPRPPAAFLLRRNFRAP